MIKLFSGKKLFMILVHWGTVSKEGKNYIFTPDEEKYAIPRQIPEKK